MFSATKRFFQVCTSERGTMELADRTIGLLLTVTSLSIFTYYTFWVIILPLVDTDHFVHRYFLPQEYAILIPVFIGMALICLLSMFIGYVMLKSKKNKAWYNNVKPAAGCKIIWYFIVLLLNSLCHINFFVMCRQWSEYTRYAFKWTYWQQALFCFCSFFLKECPLPVSLYILGHDFEEWRAKRGLD